MTSLGPAHQSHDYKHMYMPKKDLYQNKIPNLGAPNSLYGIISSNPDFTLFRKIVMVAGVEGILSADQFQGTLFVPSDTFFEENLNLVSFDKTTALSIFNYLSLPTMVRSKSLQSLPFSRIRNRHKTSSYIDVKNINNTCILDNDANIVSFDIEAKNGLIHVIDRLLMPMIL